MARGRMLNKSIVMSPKVADLPNDTARLMATWIIAHLDVRGVFYGQPAVVRAQLFPEREDISTADVKRYLEAMETVGLINLFMANGRVWQYWPGFADNQIGLRADRETSDFPRPPRISGNDDGTPPPDVADDGGNDPASTAEKIPQESGNIPEDIPLKGKEVKGSTREVQGKERGEKTENAASPQPAPNVLPPNVWGKGQKKPKTAKPPAEVDPRTNHPAIQLVREITSRYPDKSLWDSVIQALGESPDKAKAMLCWQTWLGRGYNRNATTPFTEWYVNGCPEQRAPAQRGKATTQPTGSIPDFAVSMDEVKARRANALWAQPQGGNTK